MEPGGHGRAPRASVVWACGACLAQWHGCARAAMLFRRVFLLSLPVIDGWCARGTKKGKKDAENLRRNFSGGWCKSRWKMEARFGEQATKAGWVLPSLFCHHHTLISV